MMFAPFERPVFHFPVTNGSIVLAIDAQKPWETVENYTERVIQLLAIKRMSEKFDSKFMLRVFLGGLREAILDDIMVNKMHDMKFRTVVEYAKLLEITAGAGPMGVQEYAPVATPGAEMGPRRNFKQDGQVFYGVNNEIVDRLYQRGGVRSSLKILYRR